MIEKRLTLAALAAIVVQTAGALVWAGASSARLDMVEARTAGQAEMSERLARVEVRLEMAAEQLGRIEKKLDEDA